MSQGRAGAIISTWNPYGSHNPPSANHRLTRAYLKYLSHHNYPFELLWGGSEDMLYRELSVFVPCDFETAQQLSKQAKQLAFYYVSRRGRVTLCSTFDTKPIAIATDDINTRWRSTRLPKDNQALCCDLVFLESVTL